MYELERENRTPCPSFQEQRGELRGMINGQPDQSPSYEAFEQHINDMSYGME
ncbi:hypothetical protein DPMN_154138 [Dreissena polymorpha]|uniref:Uncharacterized protein n=1 Tax=Dreissena polymorpha TaxID=45954 RepID=A0A9D4FQ74_DREPO|nr:hypothetical protein DPMN_154138 [Dreissena polymorpha]